MKTGVAKAMLTFSSALSTLHALACIPGLSVVSHCTVHQHAHGCMSTGTLLAHQLEQGCWVLDALSSGPAQDIPQQLVR